MDAVDQSTCLISYLWKSKPVSKHYATIMDVWKRKHMPATEGNNDVSRSAQIIWSLRWLIVTQQVKKEPTICNSA